MKQRSPFTLLALALGSAAAFGSAAARAAGPAPVAVAPGFDQLAVGHAPIAWNPKLGPDDRGVPREIGCGIVNTLIAPSPAFTFEVKAQTRAALTVFDTTKKFLHLHAVAVFIPGNRLFCMGGKYETTASVTELRDWEPGTYEVYPLTDCNVQYEGGCKPVDWPADTYRFQLVELTPKTVALTDGFTPNPMPIEGLRLDARTQRMPQTETRCGSDADYTTKEPALVLTLDHPWPHLRVYAEEGARELVLTDANGRSGCTNGNAGDQRFRPYADLADVPAGRLEVRVAGDDGFGAVRDERGRRKKSSDAIGEIGRFAVSVEDFGRPRDTAWAGVPALAVGKGIAAPLVATVATAPGKPDDPQPTACGDHRFGAQPAALLDVSRPLDKVWLRLVTGGDGKVLVAGPFGDDGRETQDFDRKCYDPGTSKGAALGRLEMGRYEVYVGFVGAPAPFAVAVGDDATTLDPLAMTLTPAEHPPLLARGLPAYFGFLPREHMTADVKQGLFLAAPEGLFVYPKFDLDEATAKPVDLAGDRVANEKLEWPKKDEPLLVSDVRGRNEVRVLAADASSYLVEVKYLVEREAGPRVVPATARNIVLEWDDAVRIATPAEAKEIAAYEKARDRTNDCQDRALDGVSPEYRLAEQSSGGSVTVSSHYSDRVLDATYAKCGGPGVDAMQQRILKKLDAGYRKRLAEGLAKIKARLAP